MDNNRSGWGHVLADDFRAADEPARPRLTAYDWLDWGRDYYAAVTFSGAGDDHRVMLGWMNNWDYANDIPTSTWRSAMSLPREVRLVSTPEGPRLHQQVVSQIAGLRRLDEVKHVRARNIRQGTTRLPASGELLQIDAVIDTGSADAAGISVLGDAESATRIGYDARRGELLVDRTDSGRTDFHPAFASIDRAPVIPDNGKVKFRVYVDRASVEVFNSDGMTTLTDQVFPNAGAKSIGLWAEGGTARLHSLTVTPLDPAMWAEPTDPKPRKFRTTVKPRIVGPATVGTKLHARAHAARWRPVPTDLRYRWYVAGKPIHRSTGPVLKLSPAFRGKRVQVRVTGRRDGYLPATAWSVRRRVR